MLMMLSAGILAIKAQLSPVRSYKRTELWVLLAPEERPDNRFAQQVIGVALRDVYLRFTGYFAPNREAYELDEMKSFLAANPDAQVALDQLAYARSWFATYNTVAVRKALEDEVQAVMSDKIQPAEALKAASLQWFPNLKALR
ncbi:MAG: hypothetical protein HC793_02875 [Aquincola sp.]|nr:hypothetical protein [Aquincola sp.]